MKTLIKICMAAALLAVGMPDTAAQVTVNCNELKLKGNTVYIDATVRVDAAYVESKKSLTLTPVLENESQKMGLPSILLNGKNRQKVYDREIALGNPDEEPRYAVIRAYEAPEHTIAYKATVPWEPWMANARFVLAEDLCGCGVEEAGVIPVADNILRMPDKRYEPVPAVAFIRPEAEVSKGRSEEGSAYVEFAVGRYQVLPDFRNNRSELDKIRRSIELVNGDEGVTINNVSLKGFASPEGSYAGNTRLASNRTQSMRDYVATAYGFKNDIFTLASEPEDWAGFKQRVEADSNVPNRSGVLAIINGSDTPDRKEAALKALDGGAPYRYVLENIFPSLRHTDYRINYTVRGFELSEARQIIKTRAKNLSLEEMFAVANSYPAGSAEFNETFDIAVREFPEDPTANLNAGCIALNNKDLVKARQYLSKAGNSPQAAHARGILALLEGNYQEAGRLLEQAKAAGVQEAGANLEELRKKTEDNALFDSFK